MFLFKSHRECSWRIIVWVGYGEIKFVTIGRWCNYCLSGWFGEEDAMAGCCSASTVAATGCWRSGSMFYMVNETEQ